MMTRRATGFSLIEILVVMVILAILATVVVPRFFGEVDRARVTKAQTDVQAFSTSLNLYKLHNFTYPSTDQGLNALVTKPAGTPDAPNWQSGGYIEALPKDPWGRDYQYLSPGQHGEFDVYSLGADGQLGGDGFNADVGNWTKP